MNEEKYVNDEPLINVRLTQKQLDVFQKWLDSQTKIEESKSTENLIERAKYLKAKAKELYPKKEFEIYVDEDLKMVHFKCLDDDRFFSNVITAECLLKISKMEREEKVNRRIYV